ncbi:hypothetical protein ACHWQZ_G000556 [Mnemiopsis leidyi]
MGNDKPPQLQDGKDYLRWKREVEIWVLGTSAAASKQAALCVLSIKDEKARDFATRLSHTELKKAEGLKYLLEEMDKFYKEDSTQCIFLAIEELEKFRRGKLTMTEYIAEFHRKVNQINELLPVPPATGGEAPPVNPIYHDSIQAYKMLVQADLTPEQVTLVKAAMGKDALSTDNIEECLKRCYGDKVFCGSSSSSSKSESVKIKTEPEDTYYGYESSTDEEETYYQKNHSNSRKFSGKGKSGYYSKQKRDPERSREKFSQKRSSDEKQREYEFNRKDPKTGEYERCRICQSVKHFAYNCPHSKDKKVMFQKVDGDFCETVLLVGETFNKALIDTGATSNVCGEIWLNTYLDSLHTNLRKDVKDLKKDMRFRFGDGEAVTSQRCVLLPVHLCDKDLVIETYVVAGGLPFLLSRTCMKEMGVSLDIECDRIAISGKYQDLEVTNSGHYVADLLDRTENVLVNFKSEKDPKKKAIKLHRYFGHPRSKRLVDMVKNSELNDEKLIKELKNLDESCENCVVHKRDTPRPKSSLLTATDFNEVVSMDIKQLSTGDLMLHFIDLFSRNLKKAGVIWQLEKPAYGLNDSPRNWYNSLKEFLLSLGCVVSKYDPGLFYKREKGKLTGMILLHVDDFLVCGNGSFKGVIKSIMKKYDIHKNIGGSFKYVGVNISQCNDYITMDQFDYCKNVSIVDLEKGRKLQKLSPLTSEERTSYLSLLGKLSWLSYMTRPDLKFDVYTFARKNKTPCVQDLLDLNGVVTKVYQKKRVRFPRLDLKQKVKMVVFADASFGNLDNKINSSRGYVIFLSTGTEAGCLTWAANKASRVVSSTLEAETLALLDGLNHAELLRGIVAELMFGSESEEHFISIVAFTDSNQLAQSLYSTKHVSNHKLQRDIENIKQRLVRGVVSEVRWVSTDQMLADPLTKKGADCSKLDYVLETDKGGDVNSFKNYHPISNLTFLSKVIEKCVQKELSAYLEANNLHASHQSGYRANHSCETATLKIYNDLLCLSDSKNKVVHLLLDLSAAFDTVNHNILISKLKNEFGLKGEVLDWFKSYLADRSFTVSINGKLSSKCFLKVGVPQGSILGPILFILYTKELNPIAQRHEFHIHLYADDTQLYIEFNPLYENLSNIEQRIIACLNDIKNWMTSNKLKVNQDKTEILIVQTKNNFSSWTVPYITLSEEGETLNTSPVVKSLGVLFDEFLTFEDHVDAIVISRTFI